MTQLYQSEALIGATLLSLLHPASLSHPLSLIQPPLPPHPESHLDWGCMCPLKHGTVCTKPRGGGIDGGGGGSHLSTTSRERSEWKTIRGFLTQRQCFAIHLYSRFLAATRWNLFLFKERSWNAEGLDAFTMEGARFCHDLVDKITWRFMSRWEEDKCVL